MQNSISKFTKEHCYELAKHYNLNPAQIKAWEECHRLAQGLIPRVMLLKIFQAYNWDIQKLTKHVEIYMRMPELVVRTVGKELRMDVMVDSNSVFTDPKLTRIRLGVDKITCQKPLKVEYEVDCKGSLTYFHIGTLKQ